MWLRRSLFLGPGPSRPRLKHSSGTQYRRRGVNDTPAALSFFFSFFFPVPFRSVSFVLPFYHPLSFTFSFPCPPASPVTLALALTFFFSFLTRASVPFLVPPNVPPGGNAPARSFRGSLSSIKAEGIDAEMIEHCTPQCSSIVHTGPFSVLSESM